MTSEIDTRLAGKGGKIHRFSTFFVEIFIKNNVQKGFFIVHIAAELLPAASDKGIAVPS
jgi:hypothetical protein